MKLIVNHKGEQKLIVSKPDAAVLEKARGLLNLAANFFEYTPEAKAAIKQLITDTLSLVNGASNEQATLLEPSEDDPLQVG